MSEEDRKRLLKLEALEAAGVDNWDGYGWACTRSILRMRAWRTLEAPLAVQ